MEVHVIRSARRARTVSARLVGNRLNVRIPASMSPTEEQEFVQRMVARFQNRTTRRELNNDQSLALRAKLLAERYLDGQLVPSSIRYVTNQRTIFGSCSTRTREIRISDRLAGVPEWVRDYVLIHELAHLAEPNHSRRFWRLVNRYERTERARGYLIAIGLEREDGEHQDADAELADHPAEALEA